MAGEHVEKVCARGWEVVEALKKALGLKGREIRKITVEADVEEDFALVSIDELVRDEDRERLEQGGRWRK